MANSFPWNIYFNGSSRPGEQNPRYQYMSMRMFATCWLLSPATLLRNLMSFVGSYFYIVCIYEHTGCFNGKCHLPPSNKHVFWDFHNETLYVIYGRWSSWFSSWYSTVSGTSSVIRFILWLSLIENKCFSNLYSDISLILLQV